MGVKVVGELRVDNDVKVYVYVQSIFKKDAHFPQLSISEMSMIGIDSVIYRQWFILVLF